MIVAQPLIGITLEQDRILELGKQVILVQPGTPLGAQLWNVVQSGKEPAVGQRAEQPLVGNVIAQEQPVGTSPVRRRWKQTRRPRHPLLWESGAKQQRDGDHAPRPQWLLLKS